MLYGRGRQCVAVDGLLAHVRAGHSRVLVVRGAPGIGKTALLGYAANTDHPLPEATKIFLLLAAAEPVGDPALLWRAARLFGIGVEAADTAAPERLLTVTDRVTFRHPLVRSVVYQAAPSSERHLAPHPGDAQAMGPGGRGAG